METYGFLSLSPKSEQKSVYVALTLLTGVRRRVSEGEWSTPPPGQGKQQGRPHEHWRERQSFRMRDEPASPGEAPCVAETGHPAACRHHSCWEILDLGAGQVMGSGSYTGCPQGHPGGGKLGLEHLKRQEEERWGLLGQLLVHCLMRRGGMSSMGSGPQGRSMGSNITKAARLPGQWGVMGEALGAGTEGHAARTREHGVQEACISTPATQRASALMQHCRQQNRPRSFSLNPLPRCSDSEGAGSTWEAGKEAEEWDRAFCKPESGPSRAVGRSFELDRRLDWSLIFRK